MTMSPASEYVVIPEWTLADRFRKARQVAGMDQRQFADALGVSHATYGHWELGTNTPRNLIMVARHVEAVTGIPAAWLLGVESPPTSDYQRPGQSGGTGRKRPTRSPRENKRYYCSPVFAA